MATMSAIRAAVGARLATIANLNVSSFLPSAVTVPMAVVEVADIPDYHLTMQRGYIEYDIPITVLVSNTLDQKSQDDLQAYADVTGSNSIIGAIYGDKTLGGTVEDCKLVDFRQLTNEEVALIGYRGGRFTLKVATRGS
jgi:hypothetical protein